MIPGSDPAPDINVAALDVHSPAQRSLNMRRIRSSGTKPELLVRRLLHAEGYRYVIHVRGLPGTPDVVFTRRKKAIFINGCFWHSHTCRFGRVTPKTNYEFWQAKRAATVARDARQLLAMNCMGWSVLTVWECETRDSLALRELLVGFLGHPTSCKSISSKRVELPRAAQRPLH